MVALFVTPNLLTLTRTTVTSTVPDRELTDPQLMTYLIGSLTVQLLTFTVALLPLVFARRLDRRILGPAPPHRSARVVRTGLLAGTVATAGAYGVNAVLVALTGADDPVQQQLLEDALTGGVPLLLVIAIAVVAAPVTEEVIFRGVLFRSLADRFGPWTGIVTSAAIFAAIHTEVLTSQPLALAGLFVIGGVLAYAYQRTGRLAVPIIGHAAFNAASLGLALALDRVLEVAP